MLHFGSIALAAEPAASTLIARAKTARERRLVCVDPNVRPAFASGKPLYRRNLERAMELGHIVKLSLSDLAWLRPGLAPEGFARERLAAGASLVVVTRGSNGAVACTRNEMSAVAAAPVPVVDTPSGPATPSRRACSWRCWKPASRRPPISKRSRPSA